MGQLSRLYKLSLGRNDSVPPRRNGSVVWSFLRHILSLQMCLTAFVFRCRLQHWLQLYAVAMYPFLPNTISRWFSQTLWKTPSLVLLAYPPLPFRSVPPSFRCSRFPYAQQINESRIDVVLPLSQIFINHSTDVWYLGTASA